MNRSIVAGAALMLGIAIASPMLAWSADPPPPDQSAPMIPPMGHGPIGDGGMTDEPGGHPGMGPMGMMGGMAGHEEMGPMGREGWHRRMMMMRMSPKQRCEERLARRAGVIAYTIAKLNLTAQQRPLWDKVQGPLDAGNKQRELCGTLKSHEERGEETVLDRMNRRVQFLSAHLQALQQIKPAMQQFYQSLTAEQKAVIDHPFRRR